MSKVVKKNVIMDSDAMRRALVRIAHEIIEKNKDKAAAKAAKRKEKEGIEVDCRSNHCNSNRSDCIFDSCTKIAISNPIIIPDVMQSR